MQKTEPIQILFVEDDDIDAKSIFRAMAKLRVLNTIHRAKDGVEALELLRSKDNNIISKPYIILLDLNLPRMNGLEFLKEIRSDEQLKDAIVFVLTTSKADEDKGGAFRYNVAGYMVKSSLEDGFLGALGLLEHYWRIVELPS